MSTPYYVSPEQIRQDKEDFVSRGIAQAKEVVVLEYRDGLLMVAENPRKTTFKISEIYDRIALAAAGRIAEYEILRVVGIRESEIKGFRYYREDVTAKWLTNLYSQHMGGVAQAWDAKPLEIELLVCELGAPDAPANSELQNNRIYHIAFDGIYSEEEQYAVIGGRAAEITGLLEQRYADGLEMAAALRLVTDTFRTIEANAGDDYEITPRTIEVACLERTAERRKFRRLSADEVTTLLS
ncbi:proteasome subunit alpha [Candidatus Poribacteria bacterium]|nr:proteasome subunit alpha [Candidatus Poribacteria bacterium]